MVPYFLAIQLLGMLSVSAKISDKEYAAMPALFHFENYEKCVMYGEEHFYCALEIELKPINLENPSKTWKIIEEVISDRTNYRHSIIRRYVCVPEVCPNISFTTHQDEVEVRVVRQKLETYFDKKYQHMGLRTNITILRCESQKLKDSYDVYTLLFGIFVAIYGSVLIYATFYDVIHSFRSKAVQKKLAETFMGKFSSAVSLRKNWQRLMTVKTTTPEMQALRCLQGYRFYNMSYVIFFHGAASFISRPSSNSIFFERMSKEPAIIVYDMSYVMQIFFMLSGFMFCYQFLLDKEKGTKINLSYLIKSLVKRYIRLTPVLAFFIFFSCTWLRYISNGPLWPIVKTLVQDPCRENWWTNLLYINNMVPLNRMCFTHSWYLAVNMQLYILSFILLYIISKYPKKCVHIFLAVFIGHICCLFVTIYKDNSYHMITRPTLGEPINPAKEFQFLHFSLYTNSAGVLAGLAIGYIFFKYRNKKLFTQKWHVAVWWLLSCGMPLTIILMDTWIDVNTPLYNAFFGSTKKLIFALGNGLILLGMTQGEGWLLRWLCETSFIYVLGRLTYCAYILHVLVQILYLATDRNLTHISVSTLLEKPVGDIALSFAAAVIATLFIEMPIIELHKWFLAKKSDPEQNKVTL